MCFIPSVSYFFYLWFGCCGFFRCDSCDCLNCLFSDSNVKFNCVNETACLVVLIHRFESFYARQEIQNKNVKKNEYLFCFYFGSTVILQSTKLQMYTPSTRTP